MPKMEVICKKFITQVELSGLLGLLTSTLDTYILTWTMNLIGLLFWIVRGYTLKVHENSCLDPYFSPNLETLIVPIWVPLLKLPWHYYYKEFFGWLSEKPIKPNSTSPSYSVTTKVTSPTHKSQPKILLPVLKESKAKCSKEKNGSK
ncbi:hypothetical protein H5410_027653 [Solanum commersonii]|uniref:DUF4283 domain-containing protein n=1 Tax=Solanum commersonii TaxID=4109 RepID=A0A9J5YZS5_SOLCO|nr:hypothetical protein H5410_027653 [Solanum commersonii]